MKRTFIILLLGLLFIPSIAFGAAVTYYVDNSCTDTNVASATVDGSAYDPVTPACTGGSAKYYTTIADINAAAATLVPGDSILFRKGQTWREQLTVPESGSAGSVYTFGAFGTGAAPIISGADILTTFTQSSASPVKTEYNEDLNTAQSIRHASYAVASCQGILTGTTGTVATIDLNLLKVGSPTGNAWVEIQTNSSGVPSNTPISNGTSATMDVTSLTTSAAWYTFTFAVHPTLTADTVYFIVVWSDVAISGTDYIRWSLQSTDVYRTGVATQNRGYTQSGSTPYSWSVRNDSDQSFRVYIDAAAPSTYEKSGVTTEPKVVVYNGVKLTEDAGATTGCAANKWDWAANVLYVNVGEDPDVGVLEAGQRNYGIIITQDYITVDGLEVVSPNNSCIKIGEAAASSDYNIIKNCTLKNSPNYGWKSGIFVNHGSNNTIQDNTVSYCYTGIMLSSYHASESYPTDSNTVSGNTISHIDATGISVGSGSATSYQLKDNIIEYNDVSLCSQTFDDTGGIVTSRAGTGNIIRYNKSYNNGLDPTTMRGAGIMIDENSNGEEVYYNICYGNEGSGVGTSGDDTLIYNNILYDNREGIFLFLSGLTSDSSADSIIKNNIILANGDQGYIMVRAEAVASGGNVFDYNIYYGSSKVSPFSWDTGGPPAYDHTWVQWQVHNPEAHSAIADPLFVNATGGNFTLKPNSPCIGAGTDLGASYDDAIKPGSTWPSAVTTVDQDSYGSWEMGAYAFTYILGTGGHDYITFEDIAITAENVGILLDGTNNIVRDAVITAGTWGIADTGGTNQVDTTILIDQTDDAVVVTTAGSVFYNGVIYSPADDGFDLQANAVVCNWIFEGVGGTDIYENGGTNAPLQTNYASATGDPLFVTPGTNFKLQNTSPCRHAGTNLSLVDDADDKPWRTTPDLGAYQNEARSGMTVN